jgi:hypothetical protein
VASAITTEGVAVAAVKYKLKLHYRGGPAAGTAAAPTAMPHAHTLAWRDAARKDCEGGSGRGATGVRAV